MRRLGEGVQRLDEGVPQPLQVADGVVRLGRAVVDGPVRPAEARLEGVRVRHGEGAAHHDAARGLLGLEHLEGAGAEGEVRREPREDEGEDLLVQPHGPRVLARRLHAVHEGRFFPRVAVEIAEEEETPLRGEASDERLGGADGGVLGRRGLRPVPVEVLPRDAAAVVAEHDAVRVERGDHLEDEPGPQLRGDGAVREQGLDDPVHHPRGVRLPGVHARRDHHHRPRAHLLRRESQATLHVCDGEQGHGEASQGGAQLVDAEARARAGVALQPAHIVEETGVRVGVALADIRRLLLRGRVDGGAVPSARAVGSPGAVVKGDDEGEGEVGGRIRLVLGALLARGGEERR
mmetsp:Transcript_20603/g.60855  ORF Transcript_20603/g.60855 Transcript_20603/m.60855 type:complete len:348 (-) Transcript_20603:1788-2831(-)